MKTDQENQDLVDFIFSQHTAQKNKMASLGLGTISGFTWQVQVQNPTQPGGQPTASHQKIAAISYLRKNMTYTQLSTNEGGGLQIYLAAHALSHL